MKRILRSPLITTTAAAAFTVFSACAPVAQATEASRVVTISAIHPIGSVRPAGPETQNIVRFYVNAAAWGNTNCRTDAADLSNDDAMLLAVLMMAYRDHKTISLYVDDTQKLVSIDTVCRVVAAFVQ